MMQAQLGMIPSWQLSSDPGINIKLNDHVQFPPGWTQGTIQPVGSYYGVARIALPDLGRVNTSIGSRVGAAFRRLTSPACCEGCRCGGDGCPGCPDSVHAGGGAIHGLGSSVGDWMAMHPGVLVVGGLGLIAAAGLVFKKRASKRR